MIILATLGAQVVTMSVRPAQTCLHTHTSGSDFRAVFKSIISAYDFDMGTDHV